MDEPLIPLKQCPHCQRNLPATTEFFHANHHRLHGYCKQCKNGMAQEARRLRHPIETLPDGYKRCSKCKEVKPATSMHFPPAKRYAYGVAAECKSCHIKYMTEYRKRKREATNPPPAPGFKRCTTCKQDFPATTEYFCVRNDKQDKLNGRCKQCSNIAQKSHYQRYRLEDSYVQYRREYNRRTYNPEQKHQYLIKHMDQIRVNRRNRKARVKKAKGKHTAQDVQRQFKAQQGKCYYCQSKLAKQYHVDHIVPIVRGGSNDPSNLVITCPTCNLRKKDKLPHEWPEGGRLL